MAAPALIQVLNRPPVAELLELDREYRRKARVGLLETIAPRRFNPAAEAWLPILHVARHGWRFTLLFSNTERAHRLGKTHDWVVIYYRGPDGGGQATVVTEYGGPLYGKRVVRGRERECFEYYGITPPVAAVITNGDGVI